MNWRVMERMWEVWVTLIYGLLLFTATSVAAWVCWRILRAMVTHL